MSYDFKAILEVLRACAYGYCSAEQDFEKRVGSAPEKSPEHLRNGLWAAQQLLNTGSSKAYKRVLIFSNDANPPGTSKRAENFRHVLQQGTALQLEMLSRGLPCTLHHFYLAKVAIIVMQYRISSALFCI